MGTRAKQEGSATKAEGQHFTPPLQRSRWLHRCGTWGIRPCTARHRHTRALAPVRPEEPAKLQSSKPQGLSPATSVQELPLQGLYSWGWWNRERQSWGPGCVCGVGRQGNQNTKQLRLWGQLVASDTSLGERNVEPSDGSYAVTGLAAVAPHSSFCAKRHQDPQHRESR